MLSQTAEYALRAVLHLAEQDGHGEVGSARVRVDDVAEALDIPRNYLSKIMHSLAGAGVLHSTRGPQGGFELAVPSQALSLARVVTVFDTMEVRSGCLLGSGPCDGDNPCAAHHRWKQVERTVREFFAETTVAELVDRPDSRPSLPISPTTLEMTERVP